MNVGRAIKLCRSQKGWTLAQLGTRTGIARSHLSMLERNQRDPSMSAMQAIANALGMPLNVLIFLAADEKELTGINQELKEKLSRAALELLSLPTTQNLF
ncbi:MAG: helix-turn-helix domain-containing protein [Acidobacteriia bacterium]|nr:helix-turn-helix domain-containing protein [Terriglobia bacterium]